MKILIEKRTVEVYIPAASGRNSARLEFACLGQELEVDHFVYRQWRRAVDAYERVQAEMENLLDNNRKAGI